jgi:predicted tellurium resistance membrane protein TerC
MVELGIALLTLTVLEIVLGIDNIIFIAIITDKLPIEQQAKVRRLGLALAMIMRIGLLLMISWLAHLTDPLFSVFDHSFSGRDLVLLIGGLFLLVKATLEIHSTVEGAHGHKDAKANGKPVSVFSVITQVVLLDVVFSLDSVITAIGMVDNLTIMITAVMISVGVMMVFANSISKFILENPTLKMLALSFLILVAVVLIADGFGQHVQKGYIYFAIAFSLGVEFLNIRMRKKQVNA